MSWAVGYDDRWQRDVGYGVPAKCDQPDCGEPIDRGLGYVCGGEPYGGEHGCGLYFCDDHLLYGDGYGRLCERCEAGEPPFEPTPDTAEWIQWKLTDSSWAEWRSEQPEFVSSGASSPVPEDSDAPAPAPATGCGAVDASPFRSGSTCGGQPLPPKASPAGRHT